jgi:DNA-binding winged helix-turn-helix (wHTH) protein
MRGVDREGNCKDGGTLAWVTPDSCPTDGVHLIDLARRELRVLGSPVPVGGRAFEIVEALVQSAGELVIKDEELVIKDELMNRIWPSAIVMDGTLHVHAAAVRKALGPYRGLLKTESRRGYRLLGDWIVRRRDTSKPPVGPAGYG